MKNELFKQLGGWYFKHVFKKRRNTWKLFFLNVALVVPCIFHPSWFSSNTVAIFDSIHAIEASQIINVKRGKRLETSRWWRCRGRRRWCPSPRASSRSACWLCWANSAAVSSAPSTWTTCRVRCASRTSTFGAAGATWRCRWITWRRWNSPPPTSRPPTRTTSRQGLWL